MADVGIGEAIVGFVSFLGGTGAASAIAATAIRIGVAVGISQLLAKKPAKPGIQGRTLTSRGTLDAQQLIYGKVLTAASLAYRNTHGNKNTKLWAVHCLAGHEVNDIQDVWLDNRVITDAQINGGSSSGGAVTTGDFGPTRGQSIVEVWKKLGTDAQTVESNLDADSTQWTSAHRLRGIAYASTMFRHLDRVADLWEAGDPSNVKFLVEGKRIYDPRLDSTQTTLTPPGSGSHRVGDASTWAWSDNPALCLADYLRDDKFSPFPGGIDQSRIDWQSVLDAADDCDTLVAIPTASTEKRFRCNGVLYGTADAEENVSAILASMNGELILSGGQYIIRAGVYEAPSVGDDLSEDDIVGEIGVTSALTSDKRVNTIKAAYIDADKLYEPSETAEISISSYVTTRDGGDPLPQTIELPMVSGWYQAQRLCIKRLTMANQELVITVPCNLRAARLVPGQRVNLTITERGWNPKVFRVLDWEVFDRGGNQIGVNLTLQEDDSSAWADPAEGDYNTLSAAGRLTIATPEPIPSVDSIPRGIKYGEGTWSVLLTPNTNQLGSADIGNTRFSRGRFVLPDGTVRRLGGDVAVESPFHGSVRPPDGRFYIVWGATNPETRFGVGFWGYSGAEGAGLFTAIYDRFNDQWYAIEGSGNATEYSFTPLDTDYVVATGTKTSASGGYDSLTALVAFQEPNYPRNLVPAGFADFETLTASDATIEDGSGASFTFSTAQRFLGTRSLRVELATSMGTSDSIIFNYRLSAKLPIKNQAGRRYLVVFQCRPDNSAAVGAWGVGSQLQFILGGSSSITGPTFSLEGLTEDVWQQVTVELDGAGNTATEFTLQLFARWNSASTPPIFYIDALQLIDVTDFPELQADFPDS